MDDPCCDRAGIQAHKTVTLDEEYMLKALELAEKAYALGEIPVGAIVVSPEGEVIGEGYNLREHLNSPIAHAEIIAIEQAAKRLGQWRLTDCTLYVTLEPCPMCAGAILNARIDRVYYGARDESFGACGGVFNLFMEAFPHPPALVGGVLAKECSEILRSFFGTLRK